MKIQRILCVLAIITSALVFAYSLGILTDLYDMLYQITDSRADIDYSLYYDMQRFVRTLEIIGIGLILVSCTLFITNTHNRRRYYVSNFVSVILVFLSNVAAAVWAHINLMPYRTRFVDLEFDLIEAYHADANTPDLATRSTFWFDLHWAVFILALAISILLIVNLFWKVSLMKNERRLLNGEGKAVSL
jgi:hypothetical protein